MKGYLKSVDGVFQLGPHITTVGRDACDLIIQALNVDYRHAIIEFNEREGTFALQDLESTHGTFVNDVRVRNAAVPLSPGDSVRFGHPGVLFQFIVDFQKETSICVPLDKRPNYFATHPVPPQVVYKDGLPQLRSASNPDAYNEGELDPEEQAQWIIGPGDEACEEMMTTNEDENLKLIVQCLREEVRRLRVFESECMFKDDLLDQLKEEIAYLQLKLRQFEVGCLEITGQEQLNSLTGIRMLQLDTEAEKEPLMPLRIVRMPSVVILGPDDQPDDQPLPSLASLHTTQQSSHHSTQNSSQAQESQHSTAAVTEEPKAVVSCPKSAIPSDQSTKDLQKELNLARGFLVDAQKDFASKDATLSKLAKEADDLRQEVLDKDLIIATLRESMEPLTPEEATFELALVKREKELLLLQKKLKISSMREAGQATAMSSLKNELESLKQSAAVDRSALRKLQTESDQNKIKLLDLERQERLARIEVEQLNKSLERFRSRTIQVAYNQLNAKTPNKKFTDDELLSALSKCSASPVADAANKNQLNSPSVEQTIPKSASNSSARIDRNAKK